MRRVRSLLFVPGIRPDRFTSAVKSGADLVCMDLEDSVPVESKEKARRLVSEHLNTQSTCEGLAVRINAPENPFGSADLAMLRALESRGVVVVIPKVMTPSDVTDTASQLREHSLIALIESPQGVINAPLIAAASPLLKALMLGGVDFCAELGCPVSWDALLVARNNLVLSAAAQKLQLIDTPCLEFREVRTMLEDAKRVKNMGFTGKAAIHPMQVEALNTEFSVSAGELAWARDIWSALDGDISGTAVVKGQFVDRAVALRAREILVQTGELDERFSGREPHS